MTMDFGTFPLKNGQTAHIRTAGLEDAADMITMMRVVLGQTRFLLREPDDFNFTEEQERAIIERRMNDPYVLWMVCRVEGELVGICDFARNSDKPRVRHRASAAISILQSHWGLGLGRKLMQLGIAWAKETGFEQVELEVVAANVRAKALYESVGFVRYGTRPFGIKYTDGTYAEEDLMVLRF